MYKKIVDEFDNCILLLPLSSTLFNGEVNNMPLKIRIEFELSSEGFNNEQEVIEVVRNDPGYVYEALEFSDKVEIFVNDELLGD